MESVNSYCSALIPFHGFAHELKSELQLKNIEIVYNSESFILIKNNQASDLKLIWSQDIWINCTLVKVQSINQALEEIKKFKNIGCYYPMVKNNFGSSIAKRLRNLELKRLKFEPHNPFNFNFTAWTMIDNQLVISEKTLKRFPFGWHEFNEDKVNPPNRAYLKLWELLTVYNIPLNKDDVAIEVGSSPGGWTWVLSSLIKKVYSIDRAPLENKIAKIKNIYHQETDAFKLDPKKYSDSTWFFSDLICTPDKIYETIQFWLQNSPVENFVCTIKFKGNCNLHELQKFIEIPHSQIIHLYHNKNEVTWIRTPRIKRSEVLIKTIYISQLEKD